MERVAQVRRSPDMHHLLGPTVGDVHLLTWTNLSDERLLLLTLLGLHASPTGNSCAFSSLRVSEVLYRGMNEVSLQR